MRGWSAVCFVSLITISYSYHTYWLTAHLFGSWLYAPAHIACHTGCVVITCGWPPVRYTSIIAILYSYHRYQSTAHLTWHSAAITALRSCHAVHHQPLPASHARHTTSVPRLSYCDASRSHGASCHSSTASYFATWKTTTHLQSPTISYTLWRSMRG